jgi:hypothetical protein
VIETFGGWQAERIGTLTSDSTITINAVVQIVPTVAVHF